MQIVSILMSKVDFSIPEALLASLSGIPSAQVQMTINNAISLQTSADDMAVAYIHLNVHLNAHAIFSTEVRVSCRGVDPMSNVGSLLAQPEFKANLLKIFGSIVNNLNWMIMNSPFGPLPIHAHQLLQICIDNLAKSTQSDPALSH